MTNETYKCPECNNEVTPSQVYAMPERNYGVCKACAGRIRESTWQQGTRKRSPNCPVCGAAPLTLCAPGCTYIEQMNELAASTLEGLSEEEKRIVTSRPDYGNTPEELAVLEAALAWAKIPDTVDFREEYEDAEYKCWQAARALADSIGREGEK